MFKCVVYFCNNLRSIQYNYIIHINLKKKIEFFSNMNKNKEINKIHLV